MTEGFIVKMDRQMHKSNQKEKILICIKIMMILASLLATVKIIFIGLDIDEEYAITMAYRIATGDLMFSQMWEPHQTSGFLCALLIKIYLEITGGNTFLVVYLRVMGTFLQLLISLFFYFTFKKRYNKNIVFFLAIFFFNSLAKWISTPEFSNMQIWFAVLAVICFYRYFYRENMVWIFLAAFSTSMMILSYPSTVIVFFLFAYGIWKINGKEGRTKPLIAFIGSCMGLGLGYILFFIRRMSIPDFFYGISQMLEDKEHSQSLIEKTLEYSRQFGIVDLQIVLLLIISVLVAFIVKKIKKYPKMDVIFIAKTSIIFCFLLQILEWLLGHKELFYPMTYFYIIGIWGIFFYYQICKEKKYAQEQLDIKEVRFLYYFGVVCGWLSVVSCLLLTNCTVYSESTHLMPGVIGAILLMCNYEKTKDVNKKQQWHGIVVLIIMCITVLFAKAYMIRGIEGNKDNIGMVRQKALSGPAAGVYYMYMTGYAYNNFAELVQAYDLENRVILYVGKNTIRYVQADAIISNFSTISTPTFDERLLQYWENYPERYPQYVVMDNTLDEEDTIRKLITNMMLLEEKEDIALYVVL